MRRLALALLALALTLGTACEPKPADSRPQQPAKTPATDSAPTAAEPDATPEPQANNEAPAASELPAIAGVHYLEIVTGNADPEATLPMIVAIHGLGDTPRNFQALFADFSPPARIILPRALDPYEPGWSWFPLRARDPDVEALAGGIKAAADTLAPAITALADSRPTRGKPIVTGFSQGGMLTFTLAVHHGELFSAAVPLSGWLPEPLWPKADGSPAAAPPIVAFHGDADVAVRFEPTAAAVAELERLGYRVRLQRYPAVGHALGPMLSDVLRELSRAVEAVPPVAEAG